jgi:hypothetical protein
MSNGAIVERRLVECWFYYHDTRIHNDFPFYSEVMGLGELYPEDAKEVSSGVGTVTQTAIPSTR